MCPPGLPTNVIVVAVTLSRAIRHEPLSTRYWTSKSRKPAVWVWSGTSEPVHVYAMSPPLRSPPVTRAIGLVWSGDSVKISAANVRLLLDR